MLHWSALASLLALIRSSSVAGPSPHRWLYAKHTDSERVQRLASLVRRADADEYIALMRCTGLHVVALHQAGST